MSRARVEFIRHAAALVYAAELPRTVERARSNGYAVSKPLLDGASKQAVDAAVSLADALDAAGYTEAV
jgi:hypothetical protein